MRLVSSLRYRDWRYLWSGLMVSQTGDWMDSLAINWLVLELTNSPLALGTASLTRGLPILMFGLVGGVVADRIDRRRMVILTSLGALVCTAALAALAGTPYLELWHIYVILILRGAMNALNGPSRSGIVGDLVPRSDIGNAMGLMSLVFNLTRMVGPALAGLLVATFGSPLVLWIHAACFAVAIWTYTNLSPTERPVQHGPGMSPWGTFVDGLRYVRAEPIVLMLLLVEIVPFVLGQPLSSILPVFARSVFEIGPQGLGWLTTAGATGAVLGAMLTAGLGDFQWKGLAMLGAVVGYGVFIIGFALSPSAHLAAVFLFLVGAVNQVHQTVNSTLIQILVPTEYRGRVLGVHQMDRGFIPVGAFFVGAIAEFAGAPFAVLCMGMSLAVAGVALGTFTPRMRQLK